MKKIIFSILVCILFITFGLSANDLKKLQGVWESNEKYIRKDFRAFVIFKKNQMYIILQKAMRTMISVDIEEATGGKIYLSEYSFLGDGYKTYKLKDKDTLYFPVSEYPYKRIYPGFMDKYTLKLLEDIEWNYDDFRHIFQ